MMKNSSHQTILAGISARAAFYLTIAVLLLAALPQVARAQTPTLTVLHDFNVTDGSYPDRGLLQASDGNFYGTTPTGGTTFMGHPPGFGTVFRITPTGTFTGLVNLAGINGQNPEGVLIQGSDGLLYGTTQSGGPLATDNGTVFKMTTAGDLTTLFAFPQTNGSEYLNGRFPTAALVQGTDGEFYGTNITEGMRSPTGGLGNGTVFKISSGGDLETLFTFQNSNVPPNFEGQDPEAPLVLDADGSFYSTTRQGGEIGLGTIFRITPSGVKTELFEFTNATGRPEGGLVLGPDNNYYGTTESGGSSNLGTYYRISHAGVFEMLGSFTGTDNGGQPFGEMVLASDGNLYGATSSGGSGSVGTIFRLTSAGVLTTVYAFPNDGSSGTFPRGTLIQSTDGKLYGTTLAGGANNAGTIFALDLHLTNSLTLLSAVSRKTHGSAGDFDLPLVLAPAGSGTVEPRAGGPTTLVFTFSDNVEAADGMISSNEFTITNATFSSASISGNMITLHLTSVTDQSVLGVTLNGISDTNNNALTGDNDVEVRALLGDSNQDQTVSKPDLQVVKSHAGQTLDQTNYLSDLTLDGVIDGLDCRVVRMNKLHAVP